MSKPTVTSDSAQSDPSTVRDFLSVPPWVTVHVPLFVLVTLSLSPIVLAVLMSTQSTVEIYQVFNLAPGSEGLSNYDTVLTEYDFLTYIPNTFVMASIIVTGEVTFSLLAALALVYYDFPYKNVVFVAILLTLMLPFPVRIVPLYNLVTDLGWGNSVLGLSGPYVASATSVFLLRQHFRAIPDSILETAKLDGVGPLKFLVYVLIPMSKGILAGVVVINFISAWNKYLWPLIIVSDRQKQVVQVGIAYIQGTADAGLTQWGIIMAGSVLALIPPLVILVAFHRPIIRTLGIQAN
ncbi:carbohydrate ABC transporter permease [Halorussus amylolyticus]|uniref:carbohydrate ABC transporter permease n=1 Tax=Halorussus amylolyticus TaxID=1126242 RepID=UPI0010488080|nr:carbohydrate ABC transporter permease [Halorussus amylolyticus]